MVGVFGKQRCECGGRCGCRGSRICTPPPGSPCGTGPRTRSGSPSAPPSGAWTPSRSPTGTPSRGRSGSPRRAPGAGVRPLFGVELAVGGAAGAERARYAGAAPRCRGGPSSTSRHSGSSSSPGRARRAGPSCAGWSPRRTRGGAERPQLEWEDRRCCPGRRCTPRALTVLLGPDSDVGRALAAGRPDRAARLLAPWREIYGDALRLEVVGHGRWHRPRFAAAGRSYSASPPSRGSSPC